MGVLYVTNYRMIFIHGNSQQYEDSSLVTSVPLTSIYKIEKIGGKSTNMKGMIHFPIHHLEHGYCIEVQIKDGRIIRYGFDPKKGTRGTIHKIIKKDRKNKDTFAFSYRLNLPSSEINGWQIYNEKKEFTRQGALDAGWKLTDINNSFEFCETYPTRLCVPASMDDSDIKLATTFRSKGRLPVLTYYDKKTGVSITRSSQPLIGLNILNKKNKEDHDLINAIMKVGSNKKSLIIVDLRPRANAEANRLAKGAGYEKNYDNCELKFLNIHNIHVMRSSYLKVMELMQSGGYDAQWYSKLDATLWLDYVKGILQASAYFLDVFKTNTSILTHCSDGWDRTAQVAAIVQVLVDPYFRTLEGFAVLIEKDWLSFGHKFEERLTHFLFNVNDDDSGPIFLQFIECMYQLIYQNPTAFEFNEDLLIFLLDESFSCRFGTFLGNSVRERMHDKVYEKTASIWTYVMQSRQRFANPFFDKNGTAGYIYPDLRSSSINLFHGYWLRYSISEKKKYFVNRELTLCRRGIQMTLGEGNSLLKNVSHVEEALYEKTVITFQNEFKKLQEELHKVKDENTRHDQKYNIDTSSLLDQCEKQKKELKAREEEIEDLKAKIEQLEKK